MRAPVFISHARADRTVADTICAALENRGVACWIATRDVPPGDNFGDAIAAVIRASKVMVLIFSDSANNSDEIKKEVVLAGRGHVPVIPLRVEDIQPSGAFEYELVTRQWIDLFVNWDEAIERLMRQIDQIIGRASPMSARDLARKMQAPPPVGATAGAMPKSRQAASDPTSRAPPGGINVGTTAGKVSTAAPVQASNIGGVSSEPAHGSRRIVTPRRLGIVGLVLAAVAIAVVLSRMTGPGRDFSAAELYTRGAGADDQKDYTAAMNLYRKAADQGYVAAQIKIGGLYENGLGVPKDLTRAREWMTRAADMGDPVAKDWLASRSSPPDRCDVINPPLGCLFKMRK